MTKVTKSGKVTITVNGDKATFTYSNGCGFEAHIDDIDRILEDLNDPYHIYS